MHSHFQTLPKQIGFVTPAHVTCSLLQFGKLTLAAGADYCVNVPGDREVLLVMLAGIAEIEVNGERFERVGGRANVFSGPAHSVYLPRGARVRVMAITNLEAALPSGPCNQDISPYEIRPDQVRTGVWGTLNYSRRFNEILVESDGRPAASLIVGETFTPSGNWSTYPPHKHESNNNGEMCHEEMYYFRVSTPEGFGLARHYSPERNFDQTHLVRDDTLLSIPYGYHTYAAAPGAQSYYLWFLSGSSRKQGVMLDPALAWTQKLVVMA